MLKIFSKSDSIAQSRDKLFFVLEKMLNIALSKTERGDNKTVKNILKEYEALFRKFLKLKQENPKKFDYLLWSIDFYDEYINNKNIQRGAEISKKTKSNEEIKEEISFRLAFNPEKELKGLTQFLNSFEKIWQSANKNNNEEISRYVVYLIDRLLAELVQKPNNSLFVEQFLILLHSISEKAILQSKISGIIDSSAYISLIDWYTNIVFNTMQPIDGFDLSYLNPFNKALFNNIKTIIKENQISTFNTFVMSLIDFIHIHDYNKNEIWNYIRYVVDDDLKKHFNELAKSQNDLLTLDKLETWLTKFDELKASYEKNMDEGQIIKAQEIEKKIKTYVVSNFKFQKLLEIIFATGAYCLFKKQYHFIKCLWEFKEPADSDGSCIGNDIIPKTLNDTVNFYFKKYLSDRSIDFWEDHHGSEIYYKQYFILLIFRLLQKMSINDNGKIPDIEKFTLTQMDVHKLNNIEYSVDGLIKVAEDLKKNSSFLPEIGIFYDNLDDLFDNRLIPFLQKLKKLAIKDISTRQIKGKINPQRVHKFRKKVVDSYNETNKVRDIFKNYDLIKDKKDETDNNINIFGTAFLYEKSAFFDDWYINFDNFGRSYGLSIANGESSNLIDLIATDCTEISKNDFDSTLSNFKDKNDIIIFTTFNALFTFFENSKNFRPQWLKTTDQIDIKSFKGWYDFKNQPIPVFEVFHQNFDNQILILNKKMLGEIIQYYPSTTDDIEFDKESVSEIFIINVRAFSEDVKFMDKFLQKAPEWITQKGNEDTQKEYLNERVYIQIYERFEYKKHEIFEGYKIILEDD